MSVVVDSSTIIAALIDTGPHGEWAERLIQEHALYAPALLGAEATNVLRRLEHAKRISAPEANAAQEDLMQLEIELFAFEPFGARIWQLRQTVSSYDAWYVAVAEELGLPLATLDERLTRADGPGCAFLTPRSPTSPHSATPRSP